MSTVLTTRGRSRSSKVRSPTSRWISCSSGSRRNRAGERMRLNAMSAWATTNTSLRRSDSATSRSSATLLPADHAAPTRAPTLEPTMCGGGGRRTLDEFTAKRTAPHLLPDRERLAGLQSAREALAQLINAETGEIALATNTSYGLNVAARALPLSVGDVVLVSDREFPANVYPWLLLKKQGVDVELAPCVAEGWPDEDYLVERLEDPRVRVLAVSFVQFSNGYRADLARLGAACRANGTFLVVDAIQGVGNSLLDVRETPVDLLACTS